MPLTGATATPRGPLKYALVPTPSMAPATPLPAYTLTVAVAMTMRRTTLLEKSATKRLPRASAATAVGV